MPAGTGTDYKLWREDYLAEQAGVAKWEDLFKNLYNQRASEISSVYDTQEKLAQVSTEKNISGAYANYLQNEMMIKHSDALTEGYKKYLEKNNKLTTQKLVRDYNNELSSTLTGLAVNEAQDLSTAKTEVEKTYESANAENEAWAANALRYEQDMLKALSLSQDEMFGENMFRTDDSGKLLGWSDNVKELMFSTDPADPTKNVLTEEGKAIYDYIMSQGYMDDYAYVNYSAKDYSNWIENKNSIMEMLTGTPVSEYSGDNKEALYGKVSDALRMLDIKSSLGPEIKIDNIKSDNVKSDNAENSDNVKLTGTEASHPIDEKTANKVFTMGFLEKDSTSDTADDVMGYLASKYNASDSKDENIIDRGEGGVFDFFKDVIQDTQRKGAVGLFSPHYSFKEGSEADTRWQNIRTFHNKLVQSGSAKKGDIFEYEGFLIYAKDSSHFYFAEDNEENRKILGLTK